MLRNDLAIFGLFFQFYPSDWNILSTCCARTRACCSFVLFLCTVHTNLNFIFLLFFNSVCVPNFLLPLLVFCPLVRGYIGKIDVWWGTLRQNDCDFSFSLIRFSLSQKTREMNKPCLETIWPFLADFSNFILPIGISPAYVVPEQGHAYRSNFVLILCTVQANLNLL